MIVLTMYISVYNKYLSRISGKSVIYNVIIY